MDGDQPTEHLIYSVPANSAERFLPQSTWLLSTLKLPKSPLLA
jgi:hypothetical protein